MMVILPAKFLSVSDPPIPDANVFSAKSFVVWCTALATIRIRTLSPWICSKIWLSSSSPKQRIGQWKLVVPDAFRWIVFYDIYRSLGNIPILQSHYNFVCRWKTLYSWFAKISANMRVSKICWQWTKSWNVLERHSTRLNTLVKSRRQLFFQIDCSRCMHIKIRCSFDYSQFSNMNSHFEVYDHVFWLL